jgi:ATPase, YjeE family
MRLEFDLSEIKAVSNKILKKTTYKIILFEGDLGVGKTTFIQEICKNLGVNSFVNSPTFSIVNQYSSSQYNTIYHIDLYRINNLNEIFDSGIEECFNNKSYCLIENPGEIHEIISYSHHRIKIIKKTNSDKRVIEFLN